jgi:hypothetical protein
MSEKQYDEVIAPILAEIANKCAEMGMSIVARVEWEKDGAGITHRGVGPNSGIAQRMALYAVMSRGNFDGMFMSMKRDGIDMSQTIIGSLLDAKIKEPKP